MDDRGEIAFPLLAGLRGIDGSGDVDRQHQLQIDRDLLPGGAGRGQGQGKGWSDAGQHGGGPPARSTPSGSPQSRPRRSEEHTSELQSLMRISYAVLCWKKKKNNL